MTKRLAVSLVAMLLATFAAAQDKPAAAAEDKAAAAREGAPMEMQPAGKGQAASRRVEKVRAKVIAVDVANREITLQGPKGRSEVFKVSPAVKRLAEIQPGDQVVMKYEQGLVLRAQKPGEAAAPVGYAEGVQRAPATQPPGGVATQQVSATMTVVAVDQKSRVVVLEGPRGNLHKVKAGPDIKLENVKPGAKLDATYTESVAVSIEKASAKAAPKK